MKPSHALRLLSLAGISTLVCQPLLAQEHRYFYGGVSAGQSQSQLDTKRNVDTLLRSGIAAPIRTSNMQDAGYKLFGGYQFNRTFGVELGYFNLGRFSYATTTPTGPVSGIHEIEGVNLDLVATFPLGERLSLLGRIGAQHANTRSTFFGAGLGLLGNVNPSKEDDNLKVGVGLQYELSRSLFLRGEAERYRINDALDNRGDVNLFSVSLVMPIGRPARERPMPVPVAYVAPPPQPAPTPVEVAPVVAPAPVVVAPPPPAVPRRVQFSADSLFGFDQVAMRPDGKAALDTFAADLRGARFNTIVVEGNTDRLGSQTYNQKLSERRAQAVKEYLTTSAGIDGSRISAVGKGETNPVTKPEDCKGTKATASLIACLQPDRRVDVEVVGER